MNLTFDHRIISRIIIVFSSYGSLRCNAQMMVVTCVDISGLEICYNEGNAKCLIFFSFFCMIVFQFHVKMEKKKTYLKITEAYLETESAG